MHTIRMTGIIIKIILNVAVYVQPKLVLSYPNNVEGGDCSKAT